ncbi:MAG TPA: HAMP domain-containing protein, partial [Rhodopila sp.]|nr:HAMP domain-containing protein [Rhodopila sp.]
PKTSYVKGFAPWGWMIGTGVYIDDLQVMQRRLELRLIGVGMLVTVMLGGTVWHIGRGISRPIVALTAATNRLADGELDTPIPGTDRHDELGMMSKALAVLRDARSPVGSSNSRRQSSASRRIAASPPSSITPRSSASPSSPSWASSRTVRTPCAAPPNPCSPP